ncbi:AAA family ATPase [Candidatus Parabeggiatoa sp. HSG14]|uniref:AAA family ATPase n=1 Tax=Candidatus Parabeggiatoa sp. HSG14 TaxID=3055593 RepID=UPI0025A6EA55|nr:AAA family ATPase [Thiotrichales bacterium HSG14]
MLTLTNYQIGSQIYESANSLVYRGHRKKDNQPVILKMLKQDYPTPVELTRYRQEYEITHDLDLTGVIKVYDIEKYQNTLVIILEDFGGESLKQLIANNPLTLKDFFPLAIETADNLSKIHAANIIHKDINPSNIVINPDTKLLKIIDFGIASRLPRENPTLKNPEQLEGTLAYLSPEQTGRINRSMDYRTDLYSLGVTFYELLTGKLPFIATDAMELVHCHIAKTPSPLCEVNSDIPPIISDIVMKLLAKNAEDRYQSAFGLKVDLEKCLKNLPGFENLSGLSFELAQNDFSGKFEIPQKLYGRKNEVNTLLQAFERVSLGKAEMMLVAGYSGVGKTALVHEVHKPMTEKRGCFAAGKFDQYQRNIPYSALTQALSEFCNYLLTESTAQLSQWRSKILNAVGNNGQLLIDVIPQLELVIDKQPTVALLGSTEAQNRFSLVFQNFFRAICQPAHPLILFIDDLQWADSASLNLLKLLMTDTDGRYFFFIGAYRDNEVDATHPLMMTVEELHKAAVTVNTVQLNNLSLANVNTLIAETLKVESTHIHALTHLVYEKTQGNAFFTHEFLKILYEEALLAFDVKKQKWQWDISKIAAKGITDNVVVLMTGKISQLPINTQTVLKLAACIGNSFDLKTLSIIYQQTQAATFTHLWQAIKEGLLESVDDNFKQLDNLEHGDLKTHFKFQHDRVQQAVYALIEDAQKKAVHLKIGRLLLANTATEESVEKLFKMIDHLNMGQKLITDPQEQKVLAKLNLEAGEKAKNATAYAAARQYLMIGKDCLTFKSWVEHYDLTLALHKMLAEVEYLNGHFNDSETLINLTLEQTKSAFEKAEIYNVLIVQYTLLAKYAEAIQIGRKALALLGITLPEKDLSVAFEKELVAAKANLGDRKIAALIDEPELATPEYRIAIELLANMIPPARILEIQLFCVITTKVVNISLKYGSVPKSIIGYSCYGLLQAAVVNDYQTAYDFGQLAVNMSNKFNNLSQKCQASYLLANYLNHWVKPLRLANVINDDGYQVGLQSGELQWVGYILAYKIAQPFYQGRQLDSLLKESPNFLLFSKKTQNQAATDIMLASQLILSNLTGLTEDKLIFQYQDLNEEHFLENCQEKQSFVAIGNYQVLKAQTLYLYDRLTDSLNAILKAQEVFAFISGSIFVAEHNFYHSLILVALYPKASTDQQEQYQAQLESNQKQMKIWADNCPENFLHKYLLVKAERAHIEGKELEAMDLYDQAIASIKEDEFIQNEALANELAAKFWLEKGKHEFARLYITKAYYGYQLWGAKYKANDLETKYPQLLDTTTQTPERLMSDVPTRSTLMASISTLLQTSTLLDLDSVTKVSQTLAGEIVLSKLLEKIMHTLIENAGAERGLLILDKEGQWVIEAEGTLDINEVTVLQSLPLENRLPSTIVNYVARSHTPVVLANAMQEGIYIEDNYIRKHQLKSVLCSPILHQGKLIGLLYLENNLTEGAFTPARLRVVDMLSSQAAISLENALLYRTLEQKVERRTKQLATANQKITLLNERLKEENLRMGAELDVAKQLQQMVLPKESELQQIEGLDIAGFMEPADEVGGDYYEVLNHDGHIKIGIGDVTGHGLESGVLMLMVQTAVRALLLAGIDNPETFLNVVNRTVYHNAQRMETDKNLTLSLLDYQNGQLRVTGQHEDVLVVRQGGKIERVDTVDLGFMVGVIPNIAHTLSHLDIQLHKGDGIVLYTDGITEARNPEMALYGIERLCKIISQNWHLSAQEIQQAIVVDVKKYIDTQKVFDDITLLVLKQK